MKTQIETIGKRIEKIREYFGISVRKFSAPMGLHYSKVGRVINEETKPDYQFIEKVVKTYNVSIDWLIFGEGAMFLDMKKAEEKRIYQENLKLKEENERLKATIDTLNSLLHPKDEAMAA